MNQLNSHRGTILWCLEQMHLEFISIIYTWQTDTDRYPHSVSSDLESIEWSWILFVRHKIERISLSGNKGATRV